MNRCLSTGDFRALPESNQDEIQAWLIDHGVDFRTVACIRLADGNLVLDCYRLGENGRPLVWDNGPVIDEVVVNCQRAFPWPGAMLRLPALQRQHL